MPGVPHRFDVSGPPKGEVAKAAAIKDGPACPAKPDIQIEGESHDKERDTVLSPAAVLPAPARNLFSPRC